MFFDIDAPRLDMPSDAHARRKLRAKQGTIYAGSQI
jgi:hypothetical protein